MSAEELKAARALWDASLTASDLGIELDLMTADRDRVWETLQEALNRVEALEKALRGLVKAIDAEYEDDPPVGLDTSLAAARSVLGERKRKDGEDGTL